MAIKIKAGGRSHERTLPYSIRDITAHTGKHIACRPSRSGSDTLRCTCACAGTGGCYLSHPVGPSEPNLKSSPNSDRATLTRGKATYRNPVLIFSLRSYPHSGQKSDYPPSPFNHPHPPPPSRRVAFCVASHRTASYAILSYYSGPYCILMPPTPHSGHKSDYP